MGGSCKRYNMQARHFRNFAAPSLSAWASSLSCVMMGEMQVPATQLFSMLAHIQVLRLHDIHDALSALDAVAVQLQVGHDSTVVGHDICTHH